MSKFSPKQIRIISVCVIVYTAVYFCRLNLSAALDAITRDMNISIATAGILQTVFAIVYAAGQMINGTIVDHVNPFRYMLVGVCGSALCNLAMSYAASFPWMVGIWTLNAAFQSMLWTPVVRIVAIHFHGQADRNKANGALAVALIGGHFCAWALSGVLADRISWRLSFRAPGVIALCVFFAVLFTLKELRRSDWYQEPAAKKKATSQVSAFSVIASMSFILVLLTSVLFGFIRDGVITWTPTILAHIGRSRAISATAFTLILPVINVFGVIVSVQLRGRGANPRRVIAMMMAAAIACCIALCFSSGILATALLLGCVCATMQGANTMLTSLIPMEYDSVGKTGLTCGMIDSFIYLGSALAGVIGGGIYESAGVQTLYVIWMAAAAVSVVMMLKSMKKPA